MKVNSANRSGQTDHVGGLIQEYLAVAIRGKWIIVSVFSVVVAAVVILTLLAQPVYKATVQVLLNKAEMKSALLLDAMRADRVENVMQNEIAILSSRALAESVATQLLEKKYIDEASRRVFPILLAPGSDHPNAPILSFREVSAAITGAIDFEPVRESDVIRINARSVDPQEAALLANLYAAAYQERNVNISRSKTRSFREFLENQAADKKKSLESSESELQGYMERQQIVSLDEESKKTIEQLSQLEATRDATDIELRQLQNQLASYQEELPQQETNVARLMSEASDPYIRQMQDQIARLEVQKDVTVAQNPSSVGKEIVNDRVREIELQIAALRSKLQSRTDEFLQSITPSEGSGAGQADATSYLKSVKQKIIEATINVQSLEAKKRALDDVIRTYEVQFGRIPSKSVALARLQRSRLANEKLYLMVEEKYNEANISEQSNIGYIEIIEQALPPRTPASPKILINIAMSVILGLALGLVAAFVKERVDVRIYSPDDLKRHGLVPLTAIRNLDDEVERLGGKRMGGASKDFTHHLITTQFPFSAISESYRQLRTSLQFSKKGEPIHTVMVTSATPGDGKSTTIANLAVSFAQTGRRVVLVDADLRRPTVDSVFRVRREPGLADYLQGRVTLTSILQKSKIEHLDIIGCGLIPANPAEILGSPRMKEFVDQIRSMYDVVLFDSSPILAVTDPAVTATLVDATILVVSAGKTKMDEVEQAAEVLESVGGKIVGVVLNNFNLRLAYGISPKRTVYSSYGYTKTYAKGSGTKETQRHSSTQARGG